MAGTKRGAHLALSLERLDALRRARAAGSLPGRRLLGRNRRPPEAPRGPVQRIGLSATVRPPEEVAAFLGGSRPVTIAAPPSDKRVELTIVVPVEDMADLELARGRMPAGRARAPGGPDETLPGSATGGARSGRTSRRGYST